MIGRKLFDNEKIFTHRFVDGSLGLFIYFIPSFIPIIELNDSFIYKLHSVYVSISMSINRDLSSLLHLLNLRTIGSVARVNESSNFYYIYLHLETREAKRQILNSLIHTREESRWKQNAKQ